MSGPEPGERWVMKPDGRSIVLPIVTVTGVEDGRVTALTTAGLFTSADRDEFVTKFERLP